MRTLLGMSFGWLWAGCQPADPEEESGLRMDSGRDTGVDSARSGFVADYASSSDFFTQMAGPVDGASPHGTVQIWYSRDLEDAIVSGDGFTAPVGAVAIKEQDNGTQAITVMTKQSPGFDPDHGDWLYEQLDSSGEVLSSGALMACIGCHQSAAKTDYLAGTTLR